MQPALLREVEPLDDPTETHGICEAHHAAVMRELVERGTAPAPLAPAGAGPRVEALVAGPDRASAADVAEALTRLRAWIADGSLVVAALVGRLADQVEALRPRCVSAEAQRTRLETAVAHLRDQVGALRRERDDLAAMRQEVGRVAGTLLERTLEDALQPLHALVERLRPARGRRPPSGAARAVDTGDESA
jgi:hypothetical protein